MGSMTSAIGLAKKATLDPVGGEFAILAAKVTLPRNETCLILLHHKWGEPDR
jgi:hypothetical protein